MQLEYPAVILNIDEIAQIYKTEEKTGSKLDQDIESVEQDIFVDSATKKGIAQREKILNIIPQDTDTLEERRFKVKTKWNDQYPYTYGDLLQRLDILLGKGAYTITLSSDKMEMTCMLELKVEKMYDAFKKMVEEIVPLNIILSFGLRYSQNKELEKFSHNNLKKFSHTDIKNRKVLGE